MEQRIRDFEQVWNTRLPLLAHMTQVELLEFIPRPLLVRQTNYHHLLPEAMLARWFAADSVEQDAIMMEYAAEAPFSDIDNDDLELLFPKSPMEYAAEAPFSDIDNDDLELLFPKSPKNYDIAYDEDGEWSYYNGTWYLLHPDGRHPLDYPRLDDYDDPADLFN